MQKSNRQPVSSTHPQPSGSEVRRTTRFPVNRRVMGEHRQLGEVPLDLTNISAGGFMSTAATGLARGDRVVIRLPHIGRIEAHLMWAQEARAGFQLERIIRDDDFAVMIAALQPVARQPTEQVAEPIACHH